MFLMTLQRTGHGYCNFQAKLAGNEGSMGKGHLLNFQSIFFDHNTLFIFISKLCIFIGPRWPTWLSNR